MDELLQLKMYNFDLPIHDDWIVKIYKAGSRRMQFETVLEAAKIKNSNIIIRTNKQYLIINFEGNKTYNEILNLLENYQSSLEKSNTENVNAPKLFLVKFHYDFILQSELNTLTFGKD